jgi:mannose-6-phosphate isomerase-like protein (cupin superfamily)
VLILRGRGTVRLAEAEQPVAEHDLVTIDPLVWHQFRAATDCPLGFLCLVSRTRDRPQLPTPEEAARLTRS